MAVRADHAARGRARPPQPPRRAPENDLYDRGCDLVEAAAAIRRLAGDPDAARAAPAVLGCIEASLHDLAESVSAVEVAAGRGPGAERMRRGLRNLRVALGDTALAAHAARALTARALARGAGHPGR